MANLIQIRSACAHGSTVSLLGICAVLALACTGCQTFSLTEEEFEQQQRGQMVDREVGNAVGVAGTAGYLGATIGAFAAGVR